MTFMQAISQFLERKFPSWAGCDITFMPEEKTLYFYCKTPRRRNAIFKDARLLANLDVGIECFVVVYPGYPDIVIPCC
jgi:hypothetical protein